MKKESYYFSHDANARKDEKILCLLAEHGYEGYGIYWVLIEMMFENADTAISRPLIKGIAYDLRIDITVLQSVITTCYNVKLFDADKEKIWSNSLRRRKAEWEEKKKKRSEAGKAGMAARWHSDNIVKKTDNKRITNDNKGKERKVNKRKEVVFIAPAVEDVRKYFTDNGYTEEAANKAHEYYTLRNWTDTNNKKVTNWKSKMISVWFKDENKPKSPVRELQVPDNSQSYRLKKLN